MGLPVGEMLSRMGAREFAEWQAFCRREPLPAERAEVSAAVLCATMANAWCKSKSGRPFEAKDFLIDWWAEPRKPPTPEELASKIGAAMSALGGRKPPGG